MEFHEFIFVLFLGSILGGAIGIGCGKEHGKEVTLNALNPCLKNELRVIQIKDEKWLCSEGKWTLKP